MLLRGHTGGLAVVDEDVRYHPRVDSIITLEPVQVVRGYLSGVNASERINESINPPQSIDMVDVRRILFFPFPYYSFPGQKLSDYLILLSS